MTPDEFRKEYVEPAVEHWRTNNTATHLAASAIVHLDTLADVVWMAQGRPGGDRGVGPFREELGRREPAIAVVRDASDSHKHGELGRPTAVHVSGERPQTVARAGFFLGHSFIGGPLTRYQALVIRKRDGTEQDVSNILYEAMQAWRREFERLGYGGDWLIFGHQH